MERIRVDYGGRGYDILIAPDGRGDLGRELGARLSPSRVALIADETVAEHYAGAMERSLRGADLEVVALTFPPGEGSKSAAQVTALYDELLARRFDRKSCLVALGGGVTGDLVGFVAATYLRGVPFVQVPTSLLAQVDSSSGGKTGINHRLGKNVIGAFHQPSLVLIDPLTLRTLPRAELGCGLAEVIKHGLIRDASYFEMVEAGAERIRALDPETMTRVIAGSCRIKGAVVMADEREAGVRAILNFGHTFAHAYEGLSSYAMRHGEAVAAGMVAACRLSEALLGLDPGVRTQLTALLARFGLPTTAPAFPAASVLSAMYGDKKTEHGRLRFVLLEAIGAARVVEVEDLALVRETIDATARAAEATPETPARRDVAEEREGTA